MFRTITLVLVAALVTLVTGCASSTVSLRPQDIAQLKTMSETVVEDIDTKTLQATFKDATVLAVKTDTWSLGHLDLSSNYGVVYHATARLVRTNDGTVISKASCQLDGKDFSKSTIEELKANNAAQLKTRLERTADLCVDRLVGELLSPDVRAGLSK